jgi:flagellar basal-body rod modification protein FlgD
MSVQSVLGTNSSTNTTASTTANLVSKDDFLKILMTQLKYQDPLNPQDAGEFLSQLSQMTQVEQLTNMAQSLEDLKTLTNRSDSSQWVTAIGKKMNVNDNVLSQGDELVINPTTAYDTITLTLRAQDGTTKTVTFNQGDELVYKNDSADTYTVTQMKATKDGASVEAYMSLFRVIKGMQISDNGPIMVAGDGKAYRLSDIAQIRE